MARKMKKEDVELFKNALYRIMDAEEILGELESKHGHRFDFDGPMRYLEIAKGKFENLYGEID